MKEENLDEFETFASAILTALENKQIDIAIAGRKPEPSHIHAQCIAEDRLVLVGNGLDPGIASLEEMKRKPFIVREKGSGTREAMRLYSRHQSNVT